MPGGSGTYDREMFRDTFENEFTYLSGFLRNVRRFAKRLVLTCPLRNKTWNYSELNLECNKIACALLDTGVRKNDVVMYQLQNCAEFVFIYIGLQKIGAVGCPIDTSTPQGDRVETLAMKKVFGPGAYGMAISSIKGATGHMMAASGMVELIASLRCIREGSIPPTINYENRDPDCDLDYVPNEARRASVRTVMSNSFGFGGQNASIIVRGI